MGEIECDTCAERTASYLICPSCGCRCCLDCYDPNKNDPECFSCEIERDAGHIPYIHGEYSEQQIKLCTNCGREEHNGYCGPATG